MAHSISAYWILDNLQAYGLYWTLISWFTLIFVQCGPELLKSYFYNQNQSLYPLNHYIEIFIPKVLVIRMGFCQGIVLMRAHELDLFHTKEPTESISSNMWEKQQESGSHEPVCQSLILHFPTSRNANKCCCS